MGFKIGDRVIVINHWINEVIGRKGKIIDGAIDSNFYAVEFDELIPSGHSCDDLCEFGYGRYIHRNSLELDVWSTPFFTKCKNESEAKHFIKECYNHGVVWSSQKHLDEKLIDKTYFRGEYIYYFIDNKMITYGEDAHFTFGKKFIEFKELFPNYVNPTKTYHGDSCPLTNTQDVVKVIINDPCVIVFLKSGEKGIAKCMQEDIFDERIGYEIAYCRAKIKELSHNIKLLNIKLDSHIN